MKKTLFIILALMGMVALPMDAQLNKLINKAKDKAKNQVTQTVNQAVDDATNAAVNQVKDKAKEKIDKSGKIGKAIGVATDILGVTNNGTVSNVVNNAVNTVTGAVGSSSSYDPFTTYKPSATAKKKDKQAKNEKVANGYSKSPAAIRGAYEHLDPALFPYQPYYDCRPMCVYEDDDTSKKFHLAQYMKFCEMVNGSEGYLLGCTTNGMHPIEGTGKYFAWGEPAINAWFAVYFADPNSNYGFRYLMRAYVMAYYYHYGMFKMRLEEGTQSIVVDKDGKTCNLYEPEDVRHNRLYQLMKTAEEISQKADYDNIFQNTYRIMKQADEEFAAKKYGEALSDYREMQYAYEYFVTKHPDWAKDSRKDGYTNMYNNCKKNMQECRNILIDENKEPQDMPKTYRVSDATILKKAKECQKKADKKHANAEIVFLSDGWRPFYKSGTHIISHRGIDVGWIYTENGQKWLAYATLMQTAAYKGLTVVYENKYFFGNGGYGTMKLK